MKTAWLTANWLDQHKWFFYNEKKRWENLILRKYGMFQVSKIDFYRNKIGFVKSYEP